MTEPVLCRLPRDHPYVLHMKYDATPYKVADRWMVKWRDFGTVKQDREFDTKEDAETFAEELRESCHILCDEDLQCQTFEELDKFWRQLVPRAAGQRSFKSHPTEYGGTVFRSRLEATWAAFFDLAKIEWIYEPADMQGWSPDFMLRIADREIWCEVKPVSQDGWSHPPSVYDKALRHSRSVWVLLLGLQPSTYPFCIGQLADAPDHELGMWPYVNERGRVHDATTLWRKAQNKTRWRPRDA